MAVTMACKLIRAGEPYVAGARGLCMTVLPLPDGARAKAHLHRGIETAAYIMEGEVDMYYGERLEHFLQARRASTSTSRPTCPTWCSTGRERWPARWWRLAAADDQEGIVLLPELDGLV